MKLLVVVRHGVCSNAKNMEPLAKGIKSVIEKKSAEPVKDKSISSAKGKAKTSVEEQAKPVEVELRNDDYTWQEHIIATAANLARELCEYDATAAVKAERIVLVGHSQGGLLCRLVAALLCDPEGCNRGFSANDYWLRSEREAYTRAATFVHAHKEECDDVAKKLLGVVMVASPNGGAFTFGQLSLTGRLFSFLGRRAAEKVLSHENWSDLATDRVFRFLQYANVGRLRYLSISASGVNRFSTLNQNDAALIPMVERLGVHFELPNDQLVEESSVDLRHCTWKSEISNLAKQYEHVRWYNLSATCFHTTLHEKPEVQDLIADRVLEWLSSGSPQ